MTGMARPKFQKQGPRTNCVLGGHRLSQVAEVAQRHYGVRVTVRTGHNAISPASAAKQCRKGRGFVLQGNTAALTGDLRVTNKGANHAVWVNEVHGEGPHGEPLEALVYDPMADGRRGRPRG